MDGIVKNLRESQLLQYLLEHWVLVSVWVVLIGVTVLIVWRYGREIRSFIQEVKVELLKASWPWEPKEKGMKKYKELTDSTLVVIIATLLMGGYVSLWDFVMVNIVGFLTKH